MPHIFQGYEGATLGAELATSDSGSRNDGQINQAVAKNTGSSIRAVAEPIIGDGAQALRVEFAANAAAYVRHTVQPASATARCSWTAAFRAGNPLALSVEVLTFRSSSGSVGKLSVSPGGLFSIQAVNTTIAQGPAVQPGGVYWLSLAVTPGTTTSNGRIEWEIYERYGTTPIWSGDTGATVNIGTGAVSLVQVGSSGPPAAASSQDYDAWTVTTELTSGFPPRSEYPRPFEEDFQGVTAVPLHYMRAGGGTGSDMAMVNGALRISTATTSDSATQWVNAFHTRAPATADSAGVLALINTPTMVGGEMVVRLTDRGSNSNPDNGFSLRLTLNAIGQTASADIIRHVNGTATVVSSMNVSGMMLGGTQWVRLERIGQVVRYKLWSAMAAEPAAWTRSADTAAELGGSQTKPVRVMFLRRVTSVTGGGSMDISRVTTYDPSANTAVPVTIETPAAAGSASAPTPTVTASAAVQPPSATASTGAPAPVITGRVTLAAPAAAGSGVAYAPTVSSASAPSVPAALASASAAAPVVSAGALITAPAANGSASAVAPGVTAGVVIVARPVVASGSAVAPAVTAGATTTAYPMGAVAALYPPAVAVSAGVEIQAPPASAAGEIYAPSVSTGEDASVIAPPMLATAGVFEPSLRLSVTIRSVAMSGTARLQPPGVVSPATIAAPSAAAVVTARVPQVRSAASVRSVPAAVVGSARPPMVTTSARLEAPVLGVVAAVLVPPATVGLTRYRDITVSGRLTGRQRLAGGLSVLDLAAGIKAPRQRLSGRIRE